MIIYYEKDVIDNELTLNILNKFQDFPQLQINNYKNIFDKKIDFPSSKAMILSKLRKDFIGEVPLNYSRYKKAFFFKNSLNCIFDCQYCYLKGAFRNNFLVIYVNYEDIQNSIKKKIEELRLSGFKEKIIFYASDYSDTIGLENITNFHSSFINFFEQFENVILETRTKSSNIDFLLNLKNIPKNTEISYSLNPEFIINRYELKTSSLDERINSINKLIEKGYKVGIRFLPLIQIENYMEIYEQFINNIKQNIDFNKINSIEIGALMYTKDDYKNIIKRKNSDFLYKLTDIDNYFVRSDSIFRENIYRLFRKNFDNIFICME